jgi:hypothetical protein
MMSFKFVRVMALSMLWIMLTGLSACPMMDKNSPPEIENLVYIPQRAPVEEGKTTAIIGSFNITHKSGETASVNAVAYDSHGKEVASVSLPLDDAEQRTANTLAFGFDMSTATKGKYTFQVSIKDDKGRQSNALDGTFEVTDLY